MILMLSKLGEVNYNNFGSKMEIIAYRKYGDIDIYFEEYNWVFKNANYSKFKEGKVKCPYKRRVCNVGFIGEGKYKTMINKKPTISFTEWTSMLYRCYDNKNPIYNDVTVCEEWHNFQNFAKWFEENYYKVKNETMVLDKDIFHKNKREYSPETCFFIPERINKLINKKKRNKKDIDLPVGVSVDNRSGKYAARCRVMIEETSKSFHLGLYNTIEEAFIVYKNFKENYIKQVADEYYDLIPRELWKAMYEYEIEITD